MLCRRFTCAPRLRGFNSFVPLSALLWLNPSELENMLRGQVSAVQAHGVPSFMNLSMPQPPSHSIFVAGAVVLHDRLDGLFEAESRLR